MSKSNLLFLLIVLTVMVSFLNIFHVLPPILLTNIHYEINQKQSGGGNGFSFDIFHYSVNGKHKSSYFNDSSTIENKDNLATSVQQSNIIDSKKVSAKQSFLEVNKIIFFSHIYA